MGKEKVAILGGGPAALSVAWELTESPDWANRYEIDVYTLGWRLGGKCASGRDGARRWRNEEHGLHILGGFYHNTFQQLRPLYAAWQQDFATAVPFEQAFTAQRGFTIAQQAGKVWRPVRVNLPPRAGDPGVNPPALTVATLLRALWDWIEQSLGRVRRGLPLLDWTVNDPEGLHGLLRLGLSESSLLAAADLQAEFLQLQRAAHPQLNLLEPAALQQRALEASAALMHFANSLPVVDGADWRQVLKFLAATSTAMMADWVLLRGFDAINAHEAAAWLRERGRADEEAIECPLFQASYHYAFAYVDGDPRRKDIAAGSGMRGLLRMLFTYQGTVFQHMNGGMGEIFCVPYFEVLRKRGVRFHFFHRVESLVSQGNRIQAIAFRVQATAKGGSHGYEPLVEIDWAGGGRRRCWPTAPRESELVDPEQVRGIDLESWHAGTGVGRAKTLVAGTDFDHCVLTLPAGILPHVSSSLAAQPWKDMLGAIATTPTISAQLWRHDDVRDYGGLSCDGLFTGYVLPHSTWADLSFQRDGESDRADQATLSLLCGPAPLPPKSTPSGSGFAAAEAKRAEKITDEWLRDHAAAALPGIAKGGRYDQTAEYDRYVRMNSDPVSLYVLTPAGSVDRRLRCDESGYTNMLLAGDWTRHNLDMGAVEAAVQSGRLCARALCGYPEQVYGERDHP